MHDLFSLKHPADGARWFVFRLVFFAAVLHECFEIPTLAENSSNEAQLWDLQKDLNAEFEKAALIYYRDHGRCGYQLVRYTFALACTLAVRYIPLSPFFVRIAALVYSLHVPLYCSFVCDTSELRV